MAAALFLAHLDIVRNIAAERFADGGLPFPVSPSTRHCKEDKAKRNSTGCDLAAGGA